MLAAMIASAICDRFHIARRNGVSRRSSWMSDDPMMTIIPATGGM